MRMLYITKDPPITKDDDFKFEGGLFIFYILNLSIEKNRTIKGGHNAYANMCKQVLNLTLKHPQSSTKTASSSLLRPLLSGLVRQCCTWSVAMPQIGYGTTTTYLTVGNRGGIYTSFSPSQRSSSSPSLSDWWKVAQCSLSLSSISTFKLSNIPLDFHIIPWEKKAPNSIREQIHLITNSKSTWFVF